MSGSDALPSILDPEQLGCLLWILDDPLSAIRIAEDSNTEHSLMHSMNGEFSGWVSCSCRATDEGLALEFHLSIRNTHVINFPTELLHGFSLGLRQGNQLLAEAPLKYDPARQPVTANLTVTVGNLDELNGARLYVTDKGRYCWDHTHCTGCGQMADAESEPNWEEDIDPGPAGSKVIFCPSCLKSEHPLSYPNGMLFNRDFSTPAHPVHRS